ncbi:MAG TPA: nuclear transport factor 2 family protein [Gaiellaceae bacterium]|nr:nuclear transport factor 2 family protein [Gaiellaceae bacterium]
MDRADVDRWLDAYVAAWRSNERSQIEALFTEDARYRYHPWDEPIVGAAAIADAWLEDQDDPARWEASYECYAADGSAAVAVGSSTYLDAGGAVEKVYDNAYVLRFAADGRCSEFTEWFMKRP